MLTFIHLSDIHFSSVDDGSQFDLNQKIRKALVEDLSTRPAGTEYDALLITGDIAFSGKKEEYETAKDFLEEIYDQTGLSMKETYVVPGNHDVDRNYVQPNFPLWDSHEKIRRNANPTHWRETIKTQIQKDPAQLLLTPFRGYNDFAQGCGCQTTANQIAWSLIFPKPLEFDFQVRLHGLNSALISDRADAPAKLLISEFQTTKLCNNSGEVNVVMSHHPPDWLMDKAEIRKIVRKFAPVALYGHEHSARLLFDDKQFQLFAGALQPERDTQDWFPTYHIFQLGIMGKPECPELIVRVHTREYYNYNFRSWRNENDNTISEGRFPLTPQKPTTKVQEAPLVAPSEAMIGSSLNVPVSESLSKEALAMNAQRQLLVHFFQLPTPLRYEAAFQVGLLRDGDDTLDPQVMWAEVFRRATEENKLGAFWNAVATHTPIMNETPNPFMVDSNAQKHD